mmetsp:Transcript_12805/g.47884  ORF Transcript_12805/g.47884 Transcript_12805/m.47884 type:complete len:210 (-) Transcript_12805:23-652(-)
MRRRRCVIVFAMGAGPSSASTTVNRGFVRRMFRSRSAKSFLKKASSCFVWCAATCSTLFTSMYTWSYDDPAPAFPPLAFAPPDPVRTRLNALVNAPSWVSCIHLPNPEPTPFVSTSRGRREVFRRTFRTRTEPRVAPPTPSPPEPPLPETHRVAPRVVSDDDIVLRENPLTPEQTEPRTEKNATPTRPLRVPEPRNLPGARSRRPRPCL